LGLEDVRFLGGGRISKHNPMMISLRLSEITSMLPSRRTIHHVKPAGEDGAGRRECPDRINVEMLSRPATLGGIDGNSVSPTKD